MSAPMSRALTSPMGSRPLSPLESAMLNRPRERATNLTLADALVSALNHGAVEGVVQDSYATALTDVTVVWIELRNGQRFRLDVREQR